MLYRSILVISSLAMFITSASADSVEKPDSKRLKGYHVSSIIEQWGQPTSTNSKRHYWKECAYTGYVVTNCQYGNCRSHQETVCCHQYLNTDKDGIITSSMTKGRVFNSCAKWVDYHQLSRHKRYSQNMYGFITISSDRGVLYDIKADKKQAQSNVQSDCQGLTQCTEIQDFSNSCAAAAKPNSYRGVTAPADGYFIGIHKERNTATQHAITQCEKTHGKGACHAITLAKDTGNQAVCALDYR